MAAPASLSQPRPSGNAWIGLLQIFFSPGETFETVDRTSAWAVPFFARLLAAIALSFVTVRMIGMETIVRKQFEARPELAERLGKDKVDEIVQQSATPFRERISYGAAALGAAVVTLVTAGVFAGLLRVFDAPAPSTQSASAFTRCSLLSTC